MSGWFGLLGSGEFEGWSTVVDRWLLERATGDGRVIVLATASAPEGDAMFDGWSRKGLDHYRKAGLHAEALPVRDRVDATDVALISAVDGASMVFFSGGNPAYLARTLVDTPLWAAIGRGLDRGMAYGGCSAGMACLGGTTPDSTVDDLSAELWQPGLAVFPRVWFGPHWNMLDRYTPGLEEHVISSVPEGDLLIGVDEKTALVGDGHSWEVMGVGKVHLYSGTTIVGHAAGSQFVADAFA